MARNNSETLQSLDVITAQSSDIPALLVEKPIALPPPRRNIEAGKANRPQPGKPPLSLMSDANPQIAALQQSLAEVEQQLADKNQQIAALQRAGKGNDEAAAGLKQLLTESQQQNQQQREKIAELTAARTATALELAAARGLEDRALAKSKARLAESQSQVTVLTKQVSESQSELSRLKQSLAEQQQQTSAFATQIATLKAARDTDVKAQTENLKSSEQLKKSLIESEHLAKELVAKNAGLIAGEKKKDDELASAKQSLAEGQKQREDLEKKWQEAATKLQMQETQLAELSRSAKVVEPKSEGEVRSYALGTFWGHEVTQVLDKVKADGFPLDMAQVSSGVTDSLRGEFRLPREKIIEALEVMNKQVLSQNKPADKPAQSDTFLQAFSKKPGTQRAEMGYYYRISKKGQGKIGKNDKVAISVKESLANGKVIKDMAQTGKVLALSLSEFPPLFSSAVGKLGNKGKLVMAVPPELAYGEQGRPPEIPPSSTMVYEITVMDVRPAGK